MESEELFDTPEMWRSDPRAAFDAFLLAPDFLRMSKRLKHPDNARDGVGIRQSSATIYRLMFGKFLRWLEERGKELHAVDHRDLMAFLNTPQSGPRNTGKVLTSSIRVRYIRLLERVFAHLGVQPNPARDASFDIYLAKQSGDQKAAGRDLPTAVMTEAEQLRFLQCLPAAPAAGDGPAPSAGWKRRRDRAMQALLLGAGLKVSEVLQIGTDDIGQIDVSGSVPVTIRAHSTAGSSREHTTMLRPFAVREVMFWVAERKRIRLPGPLLFPRSTKDGAAIDKSTLYLAIAATFERAGIEKHRTGGRTLRNSFAVRELKKESTELVGEFLGHRTQKSTELYERIAAAEGR